MFSTRGLIHKTINKRPRALLFHLPPTETIREREDEDHLVFVGFRIWGLGFYHREMLRKTCLQVSRFSPSSPSRLGFLQRWMSSSGSSSTKKRFVALWGNGDFGRLGLGHLNSQWKPAICGAFHGDDTPTAISCGGAHTLFLTGIAPPFNYLLSCLISWSSAWVGTIH